MLIENPRAMGHMFDPVDDRDYTTERLAGALQESPHGFGYRNPSSDLRVWGSKHTVEFNRNQFTWERCVGEAVARAAHIRAIIDGFEHMPFPSPSVAWKLGLHRRLGKGAPLVNEGTYPRDVCAALQEWGMSPILPEDSDPHAKLDEIPDEAMREGSDYRVGSFYAVTEHGEERIQRIEELLSTGVPVCIALEVDDAFMGWTGSLSEAMPSIEGNGLDLPYHYVPIIGHGPGWKLIVNSWAGWGDGMQCARIPDSRVIRGSDARAVLVSPMEVA